MHRMNPAEPPLGTSVLFEWLLRAKLSSSQLVEITSIHESAKLHQFIPMCFCTGKTMECRNWARDSDVKIMFAPGSVEYYAS